MAEDWMMALAYRMELPAVTIEVMRGPRILTGCDESGEPTYEEGITWIAKCMVNGELVAVNCSMVATKYYALKREGVAIDAQNEKTVLVRLYKILRSTRSVGHRMVANDGGR